MDPSIDLSKIPPAAPFVLHFSYPIDTASAGAEPFLLTFPWIEGQSTWDETFTTLTFQPSAPLTTGQQYHIFLNQSLKNSRGQGLNGARTWVFTMGKGPKVVSRTLGENTVPRRQPVIKLAFDRPMNPDSVAAALSVQPTIPFELGWQSNTLVITSTQVLTPGLMLAFTIDGCATDAEGAPLEEDYAWPYGVSYFYLRAQDFYNRNKVIWKSNYSSTRRPPGCRSPSPRRQTVSGSG